MNGPGSEEREDGAFDRVYRGILRGLYERQLVPGQRLIEPDIMREFGVGRGIVREVLNRLTAAGIVDIVRHRGATIRRMSRRDVCELLDIVDIMLALAARRAAENASDADGLAALVRSHNALEHFEETDDFEGFLGARETFLRALVRQSGSRELVRLFPDMQVNIMRLQLRHFNRAADGMRYSDYAAITDAICAGDADAAEAAAHDHVRDTIQRVAGLPDRAFEQD